MASQAAASLTSALLVTKGRASAVGFAPEAAVPRPEPCDRPLSVVPGGGRTGRSGGFDGRAPRRSAKLSLRLDPDRHLRLKLLSAHQCRSGQALLIEALDRYLAGCDATQPGGASCACLASAHRHGPDR